MSTAAGRAGGYQQTEWKEEKELMPSLGDVESTLLRLYEGLGAPTTSSLTPEERQLAERTGSSYLFGEVLPAGVSKMLDEDHLDAASARTLYDLGMGCGRLCMQSFLQYPNLREVVGVELSSSRAAVGMEAIERLYEEQRDDKTVVWRLDSSIEPPQATVTATCRKHNKRAKTDTQQQCRLLSFREGDLFDTDSADVRRADILVLETNILPARWRDLVALLASAKVGSRILTYNRLEDIYGALSEQDETVLTERISFPWRKLPDRCGEDHYAASWGNARFYVYKRML